MSTVLNCMVWCLLPWSVSYGSILQDAHAVNYPHPGHVELNGADNDQDQQPPKGYLRQRALLEPSHVLQRLKHGQAATVLVKINEKKEVLFCAQ